MGHLDHAAFGWLTPVLSYVMACIGAALGLRCTVRALGATGRSRRNWLITAASAIGTGIWTMHFVAMLGFGVSGTDIRYDVPLTIVSLLVAMAVVCAGVFAVGYSRDRGRALFLGGLTTGLGVASMHYLGMAAVRLHGDVTYDPVLVGLSIVIAVVAATAALWAALNIKSPIAVTIASLIMGAAVSSMHYTGMFAVRVHVTPSDAALPGATAMQFIFPLAVGLGSYLFLTSAFVALSPTTGERQASASAQAQRAVESVAHSRRARARDGPDSTPPNHSRARRPCVHRVGPPQTAPRRRSRHPRAGDAHMPDDRPKKTRTTRRAPCRRTYPCARGTGGYAPARSAPRSSACSWCPSSRCSRSGRTPRSPPPRTWPGCASCSAWTTPSALPSPTP